MIHDADTLRDGQTLDYDLCVIGSGPAGMTIANELSAARLRLCLLESGQQRRTAHAEALKRATWEGIELKTYSRERVLGGASTTWAGLSAPLDPIDFGPRHHLRGLSWPFGGDTLVPFYERASRHYGFPPLEALAHRGPCAPDPSAQPGLAGDELEEKPFMAATEPRDFGAAHGPLFDAAHGPDCYLDASVKELRGRGDTQRVREALVMTRSGKRLHVRARAFVIAAGGIENARLLLNSTDICSAGLGNEHDQLGRGMMNHPKMNIGVIELSEPAPDWPYYFGAMQHGFAGYVGLRLSEAIQRERGLLNSYVRLEPLYPWSGNPGVESLISLVKRCQAVFRLWKKRHHNEQIALRDYAETGDDSTIQNEYRGLSGHARRIGHILRHLPRVMQYAHARLRPAHAPAIQRISVRHFLEMAPAPENRVTLSDARDAHGYPLPHVRHQLSELDKRSICAVHEALGQAVEREGLGKLHSSLRVDSPELDRLDEASHHLGTTRMGIDPTRSVVDPDGKLHEVSNVYLAGGSVFPSSGCANPTYTIVALSIRLADHLRAALEDRAVLDAEPVGQASRVSEA